MTRVTPAAYTGPVDPFLRRASRWIIAGLGTLLIACAAAAAPAAADTSTLEVGDQAVVIVQVRGKGNELTVHTWDRPTVQIEAAGGPPAVERRTTAFGTTTNPLTRAIPPMPYVQRENGQIVGGGMMPPEDFPYAAFRPGPHDVVRVIADENAHLVITVPNTTGVLSTMMQGGQTTIDGYHGANLFAVQGQGRIQLNSVTTTAFLQMNHGTLAAADTTFERVRVRSNGAQVLFERSRSKQIEATTISGSIIYDGGAFDPGLARFESQSGAIALGVSSPVQLAGRSQEGHIYTSFDHGASVTQPADGTAAVTYAGGGPLVNCLSARGNVYFYDGSLMNHHTLSPEWRPVQQLLVTRRRAAREQSGETHRHRLEVRHVRGGYDRNLRAGTSATPRRPA